MLFLIDRLTVGMVQVTRHTLREEQPGFSWKDTEEQKDSHFDSLEALSIDYFEKRYTGEQLYDADLIGYDLDNEQLNVLARAFITAQLRPVAPAAYLSGFVQAAFQFGRISTAQYNDTEFQASISFLSMLLRNRTKLGSLPLDLADIPF